MSGHLIAKAEVIGNTLHDIVNGVAVEGLVRGRTVVALRPEHVIAQPHVGCILKVQGDSFDNGSIDGDIPVLLMLSGVLGFLLQNSKAVFEGELFVDDMGEPEQTQIADAKTEVDTNDEEHVVPVPFVLDEVL